MKRLKISLLSVITFFMTGAIVAPGVLAQTQTNLVCRVFPFLNNIDLFGIGDLCGGSITRETAAGKISQWVQFGLSLVFVAIIIIAVYVVIKAALKYIQSEGDDKKVGEARKSIQNVFLGLAALFVGIIGIVLVLAIFNAGGALQTQVPDEVTPLLPSGQ